MSSIDKINVGGVDFDITSSPTPIMAPVETGTTATQAYAVGDYVIVGSTLHEVTAAIAIDDTFTEGTNISTSTNFGNEIKELNNEIKELNNELNTLQANKGDTGIDISVYNTDANKYVFPSDGYISLGAALNNYTSAALYGSDDSELPTIQTCGTSTYSYSVTLVRKGMKCKAIHNSASIYFTPIVD